MENKTALFIHIARTGGASISTAPFIVIHGSPEWSPTVPMRDNKNLKKSFTFVRDPYTRFTSAALGLGYATPAAFEDWTTDIFYNEIREKLNKGAFMEAYLQDFIPQHMYIMHKGKQDAGIIGRFEQYEHDWKLICDAVGEEYTLPHLNKTKRWWWDGILPKVVNHADCHTERTKEIVREVYAEDFELLGYKK